MWVPTAGVALTAMSDENCGSRHAKMGLKKYLLAYPDSAHVSRLYKQILDEKCLLKNENSYSH
jgi:hypothetical protein